MSDLLKSINDTLVETKLEQDATDGNPFAMAEIKARNTLSEKEGKCGGKVEDEEENDDVAARIADHFKGMDMIDTLPDDELAEAIGMELENIAGLEGEDQEAMIKEIIKLVRK